MRHRLPRGTRDGEVRSRSLDAGADDSGARSGAGDQRLPGGGWNWPGEAGRVRRSSGCAAPARSGCPAHRAPI